MASSIDRQKTGLAGEFFVAAELLKRGYQVAVTLGNAKSVDLMVHDETSRRTITVQVKTLRARNYFDLEPSKVAEADIYAFVLLNEPGHPVEIFVVPGAELLGDLVKFFGPTHATSKRNGVSCKILEPYRDHWGAFGVGAPTN